MHPAVPPLKAVFVSIKIICIKEKKTLARVHDNLISLSRVHYLITLEAMPTVKEEINSKVNKYPNNFFFCNKSKKTTISCDFQVLQVIYGFKGYKVQQLIKLQDRKQSNCCAFFCTLKMLTRL